MNEERSKCYRPEEDSGDLSAFQAINRNRLRRGLLDPLKFRVLEALGLEDPQSYMEKRQSWGRRRGDTTDMLVDACLFLLKNHQENVFILSSSRGYTEQLCCQLCGMMETLLEKLLSGRVEGSPFSAVLHAPRFRVNRVIALSRHDYERDRHFVGRSQSRTFIDHSYWFQQCHQRVGKKCVQLSKT